MLQGVMQSLSFLSGKINFSRLDVYPDGHVSTGNVYKEWLDMKIHNVQGRLFEVILMV